MKALCARDKEPSFSFVRENGSEIPISLSTYFSVAFLDIYDSLFFLNCWRSFLR